MTLVLPAAADTMLQMSKNFLPTDKTMKNLKRVFFYKLILLSVFGISVSCSERSTSPGLNGSDLMINELDFIIEVTINGNTSVWKNLDEEMTEFSMPWLTLAKKEKPLISRTLHLGGYEPSHYILGFKDGVEAFGNGYQFTGEQLIVSFPNLSGDKNSATAFSYLKKERSYRIPSIPSGSAPRYKVSFNHPKSQWMNRQGSFTDYRWMFEGEWLSEETLAEQTESGDFWYTYTYEDPNTEKVAYEIQSGNLKFFNEVHFDVSDLSKTFTIGLDIRQDTLIAWTEGTPPFHYKWNTGSTEPFIVIEDEDELTEYRVTVTDGHGQQNSINTFFLFDEKDKETGLVPIFGKSGISRVEWDLLLEEEEEHVKIIYTDETGKTFYSQLADENEHNYFEVKNVIPITYAAPSFKHALSPAGYQYGIAVDFHFSAKLVSSDGMEIHIEEGKGLMPVLLNEIE